MIYAIKIMVLAAALTTLIGIVGKGIESRIDIDALLATEEEKPPVIHWWILPEGMKKICTDVVNADIDPMIEIMEASNLSRPAKDREIKWYKEERDSRLKKTCGG